MAENDGKVVFELDVDDSQVQAKIDRAIGEMRRAAQSGRNALLSLDADTAAALARLHRVRAESGAAGGASVGGAATGAAPSPGIGADASPAAAIAGALGEAAAQAEQLAASAREAATSGAGAAEALANQAETLLGQSEALANQAEAARGAEASMRSAWASISLIDGAASGLRASIQAARDAAGGISGAISGLISRIRSASSGTPTGGGAGTTRMSKYAVGLDVVPYDDYPALLHRGEMVLNAAEASAYRMGGERVAPGAQIDYDRLARAMANVSLEMDGQKVGRLVEKGVSAAQSYRYNRAARRG